MSSWQGRFKWGLFRFHRRYAAPFASIGCAGPFDDRPRAMSALR
jgi:hypothetical protein